MRITNKNISGDLIYYRKVSDQLLNISFQQKNYCLVVIRAFGIYLFSIYSYLLLVLASNATLSCVKLLKVFI